MLACAGVRKRWKCAGVDGVLLTEARSICVLPGRPPLGSNCRGASKWGALADPAAKSSPSPCTTIRSHAPLDSLSLVQRSPLPAMHGCRLTNSNQHVLCRQERKKNDAMTSVAHKKKPQRENVPSASRALDLCRANGHLRLCSHSQYSLYVFVAFAFLLLALSSAHDHWVNVQTDSISGHVLTSACSHEEADSIHDLWM